VSMRCARLDGLQECKPRGAAESGMSLNSDGTDKQGQGLWAARLNRLQANHMGGGVCLGSGVCYGIQEGDKHASMANASD
jgi:hypothetical protein